MFFFCLRLDLAQAQQVLGFVVEFVSHMVFGDDLSSDPFLPLDDLDVYPAIQSQQK